MESFAYCHLFSQLVKIIQAMTYVIYKLTLFFLYTEACSRNIIGVNNHIAAEQVHFYRVCKVGSECKAVSVEIAYPWNIIIIPLLERPKTEWNLADLKPCASSKTPKVLVGDEVATFVNNDPFKAEVITENGCVVLYEQLSPLSLKPMSKDSVNKKTLVRYFIIAL